MPWVQRARVVTPALIGGSGRAPREPLALDQQRASVRPPLGQIPQPEKNRRVWSKVDRPGLCKPAVAGSIPVTST